MHNCINYRYNVYWGYAPKSDSHFVDEEDRATLEHWAGSPTSEQRFAVRARIVLSAAAGQPTEAIAQRLRMRTATVSKWRTRFARHGLVGLQDAPRPGQPKRYDEETEHRILDLVSQPPPAGQATWTAALLARDVGGGVDPSGVESAASA